MPFNVIGSSGRDTATAERMQPEELTALLNEYLTEMSLIAAAHGGTVNKFIGDAILVFFGDPESRGAVKDETSRSPPSARS
jgi:adenylate cyclase